MRCSVCSGSVSQLEQSSFTALLDILFLSVEASLTFVHKVLNKIEVLVQIAGGETMRRLVLEKAEENCWLVMLIIFSCE